MKQKGFTLVELLAVIVILAIIALIATPMILNVIDNAKKGAKEASALGYLDAIEKGILEEELKGNTIEKTGVYEVSSLTFVNVKGDAPTEGWVSLNKGIVTDYSLKIGDYVISYDETNKKIITTQNGTLDETPDGVVIPSTPSEPSTQSWTLPTDKTGATLVVGDKICISSECFYVISNDGTDVKALAEWNLLVGNQFDGSTTTALTNPTGLQDSSAKGFHYATGTTTVEYPSIGTVKFSNSSYWSGTDDEKIDLTNSNNVIYPYLTSYKTVLEGMGVSIKDISLITESELVTLGCKTSSRTCSNAPSWVYQTSYWSHSVGYADYVWRIFSSGQLEYSYDYSINYCFGIRPVITVLISNI